MPPDGFVISIHAPLAGCDLDTLIITPDGSISIHAPLAGCDTRLRGLCTRIENFNPRTPCGVRPSIRPTVLCVTIFQSTHPLRGATIEPLLRNLSRAISIHAPLAGCDPGILPGNPPQGISIHAPLAGCDSTTERTNKQEDISIHAPLAGCDSSSWWGGAARKKFQSTHPLRGATAKTYKENCTFFELADKLSARIAAKKPSAKADRCA